MTSLEVFFDCSSPWTYLGFHNVQPLAAELGVAITWRPMLVGGVFNTVNPSVYERRANPPPAIKMAYFGKDLSDWARAAGLEILHRPTVFPVNSAKVMRACIALEPKGKLVAFAYEAFRAYWGRNEDISQEPAVARLLAEVGEDPQAVLAEIATPALKERLRENTAELVRRGGFGSPTFFVGGDDMYFGNDRLPLVRAALLRVREPA
jgi:2-hydroxychromene-2-carboxylate isomerase